MSDRITGAVMAALTLSVIGREWAASQLAADAAAILALLAIVLIAPRARRTGKIFVAVGAVLAAALIAVDDAWRPAIGTALQTSAFIGAFFTALTSLRFAADTSPAIIRCGQFLAEQPPGRRYLALTAGGHLFALPLNYGAIALLGSLAMTSAEAEPDPEIRGHRRRRMLLAIQRGFVSSLPWSPLAFAMAISVSLIPGASWAGAVLPALGTTLIMVVLGWALDTIFKPRLARPRPPRHTPEGGWALMLPLVLLLGLLAVLVGGLHLATGIRSVGVVIVVVPLIAAGWTAIQAPERRLTAMGRRMLIYLGTQLPGYRGELILLMMAGFIGTVGGRLLTPVIDASGLDLSALPAWAVLLGLLYAIPLAGQIGANPILAVSLIAPILPAPAALGLEPSDMIVAITAGWAISGACSPFTATTLLVGSFGGISARDVGWKWNRLYVPLSLLLVSGWVLLVAAL